MSDPFNSNTRMVEVAILIPLIDNALANINHSRDRIFVKAIDRYLDTYNFSWSCFFGFRSKINFEQAEKDLHSDSSVRRWSRVFNASTHTRCYSTWFEDEYFLKALKSLCDLPSRNDTPMIMVTAYAAQLIEDWRNYRVK